MPLPRPHHRRRSCRRAARAAVALLVLAGCGSTPPQSTAILQARAAYDAAAGNPEVAGRAPLELGLARDALARAQGLNRDAESAPSVDHFAYLAQRYAAIAQETARLKLAQERLQAARAAPAPPPAGAGSSMPPEVTDAAAAERQVASLTPASGSSALALGDSLFTPENRLAGAARPPLARLADFLRSNPQRTLLVEGFSDDGGDHAGNLRLGQQRADAVRRALVEDGIAGQRILTRSLGEARAVAGNDSEDGRRANRRVLLIVSDPNGLFPPGAT